MKVTEIRIDRTKSLGNYENLKLGFTVIVEEHESTVDTIERTKKLLDWEINREERDALYVRHTARLAELDAADGDGEPERTKVQKWIEKYDSLKAEIDTMN